MKFRPLLFALVALLAQAAQGETTRVATLLPCVEDAFRGVESVEIVAGIRTSFRAPERTDVVDLGNPHSPNLERLAETRANVVVGDAQIHGHLGESLGRFGGRVVLIDTTSVEGTFAGLEALAGDLGASDAIAARLAEAREDIAARRLESPVKVLALFGTPGRFQVMTGATWQGDLLQELGFENLGANLTGAQRVPGFVEVSSEHLATLRPELIVLVAHGEPTRIQRELDGLLTGDGPWGRMGASAEHGVHVLSPSLFVANPGLAMPSAAETVAALAAPAPQVGAGP